jgi:predicted ATPase
MAWDDDEEWPELSDDPEAVERRRKASLEIASAKEKVLRWVYAGLGFLIVLVLFLAYR